MVDSETAGADVTRLLQEFADGRAGALDELMPLVYAELRSIAHRQMLGERPDHTWSTRELVHEAYVRLAHLESLQWQNRAHFYAVAARLMKRLLIDHARERTRRKRGGGLKPVPLDSAPLLTDAQAEQLVALDEALGQLEALGERCRSVVEHRVFAGMTHAESAEVLGVSIVTVKRDWAVARAWLNRAMGEDRVGLRG